MTLFNKLSHINSSKKLLEHALNIWSEHDDSISTTLPHMQSEMILFETDTGWGGLINLHEWISYIYPKIAQLTSEYLTTDKKYELFLLNKQPIKLPEKKIYNSLKFDYLINIQLVSLQNHSDTIGFCILTSIGKLWITKLTKKQVNDISLINSIERVNINSVPFIAQLVLGHSIISVGLLARIKEGDVLLMQHARNLVQIDNKFIGEFQIGDNGIMIDLKNLDLDDENINNIGEDSTDGILPNINYKNLVPIKLSFVLDKKELNLADLEMIDNGKIIPIAQDCYKNIELQANGLPIAKGEMLILDDNIVIEIKTIYGSERK